MIMSALDLQNDGEWFDVTSAGSSYEVQLNQRTGQYRHKVRRFGANADVLEEWHPGKPKSEDGHG